MPALIVVLTLLAGALAACGSSDSGLVRLAAPPMGWNSWNAFGCGINQDEVHAAADALVSTGMRDAGYRYVVVDDCWFDPARAADGSLRSNPTTFPDGMAALGRYLHDRGLKFGIYESPSSRTCAQVNGTYTGSTGSAGHVAQDARTFAKWGVDFLKYDWCGPPASTDQMRRVFSAMRTALRDTGRPIVLSINPNSVEANPAMPETIGGAGDWSGAADLVRTGQDVYPLWDNAIADWVYTNGSYTIAGIRDTIERSASIAAHDDYYNDPDMLVIGTSLSTLGFPASASVPSYLPDAQARVQLVMWAMLGAPLMAGNDLTRMSDQTRMLLTSPGVIAVDQDRSAPGGRTGRVGDIEVWSRQLADGDRAVALFNPETRSGTLELDAQAIGIAADCRATDVLTGRSQSRDAPIILAPTSVELYRVRCG